MSKRKLLSESLEEFSYEKYKETLLELYDFHPDKKVITIDYQIDYQKLEEYDPKIVDLLIDKHSSIIKAIEKAASNMCPDNYEIHINAKFINIPNVLMFENLPLEYVGKFIKRFGV